MKYSSLLRGVLFVFLAMPALPGVRAEVDAPELNLSQKYGNKINLPAQPLNSVTELSTAAAPAESAPKVSVAIVTCQSQPHQPSSSPGYGEIRFCRIPLPDGARITKLTFFRAKNSFTTAMFDTTRSNIEIYPRIYSAAGGSLQDARIWCSSSSGDRYYLRQESKTYECSGHEAKSGDNDIFVYMISNAYPDLSRFSEDTVRSSAPLLFPLLWLVQAEYQID